MTRSFLQTAVSPEPRDVQPERAVPTANIVDTTSAAPGDSNAFAGQKLPPEDFFRSKGTQRKAARCRKIDAPHERPGEFVDGRTGTTAAVLVRVLRPRIKGDAMQLVRATTTGKGKRR